MRNRVLVAVAISVPLVVGAAATSSVGAAPRVGEFSADLMPLNKDTTGSVELSQRGTSLEVHLTVNGLDGGTHVAHIHGVRKAVAECPALTRDANGDGLVDFAEGLPDYGPVQVTLSRPGDGGTMLDYLRTYRHLDNGDGIASLGSLGDYAIVVHGVDLDGDGVATKGDVQGDGGDPDDNEISMPALCGVIR